MFNHRFRDSLLYTLIGIVLLVSIPQLVTAFFLVLGNAIEDGTTNLLTMFLLTRRVYVITIRVVAILSIAGWILAARKSYFYLLGIPLQVISIFAAFMLWLVFSPRITLAAVIVKDNTDYYLVIMSPNGSYELSVFECEKRLCNIHTLIQTDSYPIVDATIRYGESCNNYFIAQAVTLDREVIERGIEVQSTTQTCPSD